MNLYELTTEVLAQMGIIDPDADDRTEYSSLIKTSLNEGYRKICREKAHLWTSEAVTLDANKCFNISSLSEKLTKVLKISLYQDYSSAAGGAESQGLYWDKYDGNGTIYVPNATASGTVYLEYEYMPKYLETTYNVSGANTSKTIPVDEAITSAQATALAGQSLFLIDVSAGTYAEYTIDSVTAGAAGAATITVNETISTATADGDEIYIGDNWTPKFNEDWHIILTYWATSKLYTTRGVNYAGLASFWNNKFYEEYAYITDSLGEPENIKNAYAPFNSTGGCINPLS